MTNNKAYNLKVTELKQTHFITDGEVHTSEMEVELLLIKYSVETNYTYEKIVLNVNMARALAMQITKATEPFTESEETNE
jgi:hypothetical protein